MYELFRYTPRWVLAPLWGIVWLAVTLAFVAIVEFAGGSLPMAVGFVAVAYCVVRIRSYPKYETRRPPVVFEPVQSVWLSILLLAAAVAFIATLGGAGGLLPADLLALPAVATLAVLWLVQDIVVRRNTYRFPRADGWRVFAWDAALRLSFLPFVYVLAAGDAPAPGLDVVERLAILVPFATTATYVLLARVRTAAFRRGRSSVAFAADTLLPQPRWWTDRDTDPAASDGASSGGTGGTPEADASPVSVDGGNEGPEVPTPERGASGAVRYRGSAESDDESRTFSRAVRAIEVTSSTCSLAGMLFGAVQFLV